MVFLHPLLDFIDTNKWDSIASSTNYCYQGLCPQSGELLRLPRTLECEAIARGLMQHLAGDERHSREGKMYGILLVETQVGGKMVLKAFSGLLNGCSAVEGWVEPIPGRDRVALAEAHTLAELESMKQELIALKQLPQRVEYEALLREFELELGDLGDRHKTCKQQRDEQRDLLCRTLAGKTLEIALEELNQASRLEGIERRHFKRNRDEKLQPLKQLIDIADEQMRELKQRRKELSRQLQMQMHEAYTLVNFLGNSRSLQQLMPSGSIPTGTGDCCAPKLLHCAALHNLKPLAMAEFWWGPSSGDKVQGEFYGACGDRCQPLMGFLLSGLAQNSMVSNDVNDCEAYPVGDSENLRPNRQSPLFVLKSRSPLTPLNKGGTRNTLKVSLNRGETRNTFKVPLLKGDLGGSRLDKNQHLFSALHSHESEESGKEMECSQDADPTNNDSSCGTGKMPVPKPSKMLPIIYEDRWLIAINKPSGLLSVPGRYLENQDSVLSRFRNLYSDDLHLNAVHRLDLETSGILILARDKETHRKLSLQFEKKQIQKVYEAVLSGVIDIRNGSIALPLWGDPKNRPYQTVNFEYGKPSITEFQVIGREGNCDRIEFLPLTGRTHQLRVHAADVRGLGIPILGDRLYGCCAVANRLHLHARELSFQHPQLGETLHLKAETPF
ncbi:RluA family pseudouridine synthase [Tychonema sp. BBK16]|uniref:RluA family pseudouridine synthase n=1 Tax=Tychonema sp. BBK16 TaxID=2699888 RepID=UPI001F3F05C6|nr:RluA family pseudouridine synthase [Tychonema sp. BBK16]MCF6374963.1 pseudouridine synthase [Tychonema sp. BBK16]